MLNDARGSKKRNKSGTGWMLRAAGDSLSPSEGKRRNFDIQEILVPKDWPDVMLQYSAAFKLLGGYVKSH